MKNQNIIILSILAIGSLSSIAYATSTVITDSGITTSSLTTNSLTVSGSCTGCGGNGEGTFTVWNLILSKTITTTNFNSGFTSFVKVDNFGNAIGIGTESQNVIINSTGSLKYDKFTYSNSGTNIQTQSDQSTTGLYQVVQDESTDSLSVFKNGTSLDTFAFGAADFYTNNGVAVGISPNGKYIAILGENNDTNIHHLQFNLFRGS